MLTCRLLRALVSFCVAAVLATTALTAVAAAPAATDCKRDAQGQAAAGCIRPPSADGGSDSIGLPPSGEGGSSPRTCSFGNLQIACSTYAGTWIDGCYVQPATPQPPLDSPIWGRATTGLIVQCTPYPCLSDTGNSIPDCPTISRYWAPAAPSTIPDEAAIAQQAFAQLDLDPITLGMAPPPNLADPNVLIGAPAYFWAEGGTAAIGPLSTTVTEQGITITLDAALDTVTYNTGDGTTLTCTRDQIATAPTNMSLQGNPDCGHRWNTTGTYTLTATSNWTITWQGPTQNGTFDYNLDNSIDIPVTDRPVNLTTNKTP